MIRVGAPFLLMIAVAVGCGGPEKELPRDVSISTNRGNDDPVVADAIPQKSEAEAVKFVDKCLAAVTDGHPEKLDRAKVVRQSARGKWRWETGELSGATREFQGVWPDRARVALDFDSDRIKQFLFLCRGNDVAAYQNAGMGLNQSPRSEELSEQVRIEVMGEIWLPSLVPLRDPTAVVFGVKKEPAAGTKTIRSVKIAIGKYPVFTLGIDEATNLPVAITYSNLEFGSRVFKTVILGEYKAFDGLKLPTEIEVRRGDVSAQIWTVGSWEFPGRINDAVFEQVGKK
ncbi:MAG TPA: hypothetical protein VN641_20340 [Urbifossiella sp.]|nr:hypothetical protein [Urbifossiella sp.]